MVLFAPAFPLGASICLGSNLLRMRTDAFMLLKSTRRPRYAGAEDIGAWRTVLSTIGALTHSKYYTTMCTMTYTTK